MARSTVEALKQTPVLSPEARAAVLYSLAARLRSASGTSEKEAVREEIHRKLRELSEGDLMRVRVEWWDRSSPPDSVE